MLVKSCGDRRLENKCTGATSKKVLTYKDDLQGMCKPKNNASTLVLKWAGNFLGGELLKCSFGTHRVVALKVSNHR